MTNTVANVVSGKPLTSGGTLVAPLGSTAPTDATTALDAAFKATGYVGEDGLTETTERTTEKIRAWGGDVVKVAQTEFAVTYTFTMIETLNTEVLKDTYGDDNVTFTAAGGGAGNRHTVKLTAEQLSHKARVFEVKDGDTRIRIHLPDSQITEVGAVTYSDGSVIGYPVTVEAFYDATLEANAIKYMDDGQIVA